MFGVQVRVAELRVIQVIEGWRPKAFAVGQQHVVLRIQRYGQAAAPGGLAAELLVTVMAHAHFGGKLLAPVTVL